MKKKDIKILLVDDEPDILEIVGYNLEQAGYQVFKAENGKDAVKQAQKTKPHLIIMDVMMPEMDGFELATEIRKRNQEIPIIFLSAKTMKEDRIKGLKLGADDYLVKPYSIEELILKIEVFLLRSQKNTEKTVKLYQFADFVFEPENYLIKNETTKTTLTEREAQLLKLFLDNPNTVLKREKILMELWGSDDYFLGRSLDVFISRLRKIIKETPNLSIENIPRVGFKWVSE